MVEEVELFIKVLSSFDKHVLFKCGQEKPHVLPKHLVTNKFSRTSQHMRVLSTATYFMALAPQAGWRDAVMYPVTSSFLVRKVGCYFHTHPVVKHYTWKLKSIIWILFDLLGVCRRSLFCTFTNWEPTARWRSIVCQSCVLQELLTVVQCYQWHTHKITHLTAGKPGYDWLLSHVFLVIDLYGMNLHRLAVNMKSGKVIWVRRY